MEAVDQKETERSIASKQLIVNDWDGEETSSSNPSSVSGSVTGKEERTHRTLPETHLQAQENKKEWPGGVDDGLVVLLSPVHQFKSWICRCTVDHEIETDAQEMTGQR